MEILAPVKNLENAKIAIKKGADAIYLASPSFGARVNASMDLNMIKDIIMFAKSFNIKTYITFNTIIFDDELEEFFKQLDEIYLMGADGVILQDFSLIDIIKKNYKDLEIHASTQMHIHNVRGANIIKELGAIRVVVPREMKFSNIKNMKQNTGIEIEAFVHGALCVSYSGQCYDSTLLDQKSANRGRCSQYCRMPSIVVNKKRKNPSSVKFNYPLNLRDLNNLELVDKYLENGVDSLKIEGRLKAIDYVGITTKSYSKKTKKQFVKVKDLEKVYNREFTSGRINQINGRDLVNLQRPNNKGQKIGIVKKISKNNNEKLKFYKYKIFLKLENTNSLFKGDNLRFINELGETGQEVEKFEKQNHGYILYSNLKLFQGDIVYKTKDAKIIKDFKEQIKDLKIKRKNIEVNINISKKEIKYSIKFEKYVSQDFTFKCNIQKAKNKGLCLEQVTEVLKKTKNTPYDIKIKEIFIEQDLFIQNKNLKVLRDAIIFEYEKHIEDKGRRKSHTKEIFEKIKSIDSNKTYKFIRNSQKNFYFTLRKEEQLNYFLDNLEKLKKLKDFKVNIIISFLLVRKLLEEENLYKLDNIKENYKTYLMLPRVLYDDDEKKILNLIKLFDNLCISEIGSLKYKEFISGEIITNFTFNTTNKINKNKLEELGVSKQMLSIELNKSKIKQFRTTNSIINIYGAIPVMIMDYCPINLNKKDGCGDCKRCRDDKYVISDKLGRNFPLLYEGDNKIGLYTKDVLSLFDELEELDNFNDFFISLSLENTDEIELIIKSIKDKKNYIKNSFKGNYYKKIL